MGEEENLVVGLEGVLDDRHVGGHSGAHAGAGGEEEVGDVDFVGEGFFRDGLAILVGELEGGDAVEVG